MPSTLGEAGLGQAIGDEAAEHDNEIPVVVAVHVRPLIAPELASGFRPCLQVAQEDAQVRAVCCLACIVLPPKLRTCNALMLRKTAVSLRSGALTSTAHACVHTDVLVSSSSIQMLLVSACCSTCNTRAVLSGSPAE